MRILGLLLIILVTIGTTDQLNGQGAKRSIERVPKSALAVIGNHHQLTVGEKLTYLVKWNNLGAARFSLEVAGKGAAHGQEGYELVTRVETIGNVRKIVEVNDEFKTFLDPKTRLTFRMDRNIKEGPKVERGTILFDQAKLQAVVDDEKTFKLVKPTFDLPGLMWAIRNLDFNGPKIQKLNGFDQQAGRVFGIEVERLEKETLTVGGKQMETVQLAVRVQNKAGEFADNMQVRMWVTTDAKRIPAQITAMPPFGEIKVELKTAE